MPYLADETPLDKATVWVTYFILCNNYVPISLYVSMELAKLGQKILMESDIRMYHRETDTPMVARTSNLNEELGQIHYIFSDKTGTLTRNEMEFRKCFVGTTSYGFGTTEIGRAAAARKGAADVKDLTLEEEREEEEKRVAEAAADVSKAQRFPDKACSFDDIRIRQRIESDHAEAHVSLPPSRSLFLSLLSLSFSLSISLTLSPSPLPPSLSPSQVYVSLTLTY